LPAAEQQDVERILIAALGVGQFANLRREGLYEEDLWGTFMSRRIEVDLHP
jgi:hypothetical protein